MTSKAQRKEAAKIREIDLFHARARVAKTAVRSQKIRMEYSMIGPAVSLEEWIICNTVLTDWEDAMTHLKLLEEIHHGKS